MKKKISIIMSIVMILSSLLFTACGGGGTSPNPYEGKWIAVVGEMYGVQVNVSEVIEGDGIDFTVDSKGKVVMNASGKSGKGKCVVDGNQVTLTVQGTDMVGTATDDISMTFENFMDMGITIYFGKEGTEAADASYYIPEEQKAILGEWRSQSFQEILDDEPRYDLEGVDDITNGLVMNFTKDHNVAVSYKGNDIGTFTWDMALSYITITSDSPSLYVSVLEDGNLEVTYSDDTDYLTFVMAK